MRAVILLTALLCCVPLAAQDPAPAADSSPWRRLLFSSDFELGDLEDADEPRRNLDFLQKWRQRLGEPGWPRYMEGSLVRPAPEGHGMRYFEVPLDGGAAHLETEERLSLTPGAWLDASIFARWDELAGGTWRLELRGESARLPLLEATGPGSDWRTLRCRKVIPSGFESARLVLEISAQAGRVGGTLGIDDVQVGQSPRIVWELDDALQRLDPRDEEPLRIRSVALPAGPYDVTIDVHAGASVVFHDERTRLVSDDFPVDFTPRFRWRERQLGRGVYRMKVALRNRDDGQEITDERAFVLAGTPRFPRSDRGLEWGIELTPEPGLTTPEWLSVVRPDRVAFHQADGLPQWLFDGHGFQRSAIIDNASEPAVASVAAGASRLRRVFWGGAAGAAAAVLDDLGEQAPFLELGVILAPGVVTAPVGTAIVTPTAMTGNGVLELVPPSGPWGLRLQGLDVEAGDAGPAPSGADQAVAARLARLLIAGAAQQPLSIDVVDPERLFVRRGRAGITPRATLLAWEFTVGFLSGAEFRRRESWDPRGVCLAFARDDEEYLVVFSEGAPHELVLPGGAGTGYTSIGRTLAIAVDDEGRTRIPVGPDPLIIEGLDLPRIRTLRSLRASVVAGEDGARRQRIVVTLENHFPEPVRAALELSVPARWQVLTPLTPLRIESGKAGTLSLEVRIPAAVGIDGAPVLEGTLELEGAGGSRARLPVRLPVPIESPLVEIRPVGIGPRDADVVIRNRSDQPLELQVNLLVTPMGPERTRYQQLLAPGEERSYRLAYGPSEAARRLWVGVAVDSPDAYINRVYDIPTTR